MATYVNFGDVTPRDGLVTKVRISSITDNTAIDVAHNAGAGMTARISDVTCTPWAAASTPCAWTMSRVPASDSTANGTVRLVFNCETGGSLTGLVVDVFFHFYGVKSGGVS